MSGSDTPSLGQEINGKEEIVNKTDRHGSVVSVSGAEINRVTPEMFDEKYVTTKWETWSWYLYYVGNNGLSLFNFAPTAAQNLVYQQAEKVGGKNNIYLYFAGATRTINSIILLCNGISFAIQIVLFLIIGAYADFGTFRPWILIGVSILSWAVGFGWIGVHDESQWQTGLGLYIVGLFCYQLAFTYWYASLAHLGRNTPEVREKARQLEEKEISEDEYDHVNMMKRNQLSNVAFIWQSLGEILILVILIGILFGVHVDRGTKENNLGLSVVVAYTTGCWILLAIPWFILEKRRPGQDPGMNIALAGLWNLWFAVKQVWQLKQSFAYLIIYFLLGDSLNTTVTVIATLQYSLVSYNTLTLNYVLIVGIFAQFIGIFVFWMIQKRWQIQTKTMLNAVAIGIILLDGWGMIGNWTGAFGFHNVWEVWVYQVFYGLFVCPWYSYSQTMITEVTPRGKEFLFFSLFSIIGKTSSFIGPLVSTAIIDATPRSARFPNSTPFYFLFALSFVSWVCLVFLVDVKKSRVEQAVFLEKEALAKAKIKGDSDSDSGVVVGKD